jgi:exopolysaccharide biosynthesis predicted pyruvyltransferase EpsI
MAPTKLFQRPTSYAQWRADPRRFAQPTVQTWLKAFADAKFVVTDSFHGTVFAILNHKPFITINNSKRGSSRFDSLLGTFKLHERLVSPTADDIARVASQEIDWQAVDERLAEKRAEALSYLQEELVTK